jgi:hypothetical protein
MADSAAQSQLTVVASDINARNEHEHSIKRNPHPNFESVQSSRPDWSREGWSYSKTIDPDWTFGQGGNDGGKSLGKPHVEIDPYEEGRPAIFNYKLMVSGMVPRPIGFLSTVGKDGELVVEGDELPCVKLLLI